jgi:hypothetical protein
MTITTVAPPVDTKRADYTAGLRTLADLLDNHDEVPLPVDGNLSPLILPFFGDNPVTAMGKAAAVFPGELNPRYRQGSHGVMLALAGKLNGLTVHLTRYLNAEDSTEGAETA